MDAPPRPRPDGPTQHSAALAENGVDYAQCADQADGKGACKKPASLGKRELKRSVNIEVVLDASGSMNESVGGRRKIEVAKEAIAAFVQSLPRTANVSVRTFGNGADEPKDVSCASSRLVVPFGPRDAATVGAALSKTKVQGYTPLAGALEKAVVDFSTRPAKSNSNFVYVVSDGEETCDGDPVASARKLAAADVGVQVNVIGFAVDSKSAAQLRAAATAGGGVYAAAGDDKALGKAFDAVGNWKAWTAYYDCRFAAVQDAFGEAKWRSANVKLCIEALAVLERTNIGIANRDLLAKQRAAVVAWDGHMTDRAAQAPPEVKDEVVQKVSDETGRLYAAIDEAHGVQVGLADKRRDGFLATADGARGAFVANAKKERDKAVAELESSRAKLGLPEGE